MPLYPSKSENEHSQPVYYVIPDPIKGGWNVYATNAPQEPQRHFSSKEEAIGYAEQMSLRDGVGFTVEESEAPSIGTP